MSISADSVDKTFEEIGRLAEQGFSLSSLIKNKQEANEIYEEATLYYTSGDYSRGAEFFQMLILAYPLVYAYHFGLASCHMQNKNYENALISWQIADLLDPSNPISLFHAAECLFSLKRKSEGLTVLLACREKMLKNQFSDKAILDRMEALEKMWKVST